FIGMNEDVSLHFGEFHGQSDDVIYIVNAPLAFYLRRDDMERFGYVDAIIFDCDGVLIDIRESYDRAISKTVALIFEGLTGFKIPEDLISNEIIFLFRRSGGFNNDWDTVYGSLMFLLSSLPREHQRRLARLMEPLLNVRSASRRFLAIKDMVGVGTFDMSRSDLERLRLDLKEFTRLLNETGPVSVDRVILSSGLVAESFYNLLRAFINGSGGVGENIIARVFEEIFCGPKIFEEIYGVKAEIYFGCGMIDNGKPIISRETLEQLSSLIGEFRFGVASGSRFKSTRHVLRDILDLFNPEAQVFLDDIERVEEEYLKRGFLKVNLKKPNPYSLFKSSWSLEPFRLALFVGDSMEDAIAAEKAESLDPRFMFAGVYGYTSLREEMKEEFLKFKCDLVLPSVNEIPHVIKWVRGGGV
ncbi:MAG: hypothetical protein N3E47_06545, partial [Candidatus Bathyarchaeota archaeon]|nr:hypothetical protein [Candidatus Bathyarchaeota archaeon]